MTVWCMECETPIFLKAAFMSVAFSSNNDYLLLAEHERLSGSCSVMETEKYCPCFVCGLVYPMNGMTFDVDGDTFCDTHLEWIA